VERFSINQIDKLGRRLRKTDSPHEADLALLQEFILSHDAAKAFVERALRSIRLEPTSRLKTWNTTVDKLKRFQGRLSKVHDIAGARVVQAMDLLEQDEVVDRIRTVLFAAEVIDRRKDPNHGYRAVHVIVEVEGRFVEIQVRTEMQDLWAQVIERLGDILGRGLRYGEPPDDPTLGAFVSSFISISESVAFHEEHVVWALQAQERIRAPHPGAPQELVDEYFATLDDIERLKQEVLKSEVSLRKTFEETLTMLEALPRRGADAP
jgi:hypothetical protein